MIEVVVAGLVILIIAQNVFWAKVCLNLTNRIMSRNFSEFMQAQNKPTILKALPEDDHDPIAERQAQELNTMMGMV